MNKLTQSELEVVRHCLNIQKLPMTPSSYRQLGRPYKRHTAAIENLKLQGILCANGEGIVSFILPNGMLTQNGENYWKDKYINHPDIIKYL